MGVFCCGPGVGNDNPGDPAGLSPVFICSFIGTEPLPFIGLGWTCLLTHPRKPSGNPFFCLLAPLLPLGGESAEHMGGRSLSRFWVEVTYKTPNHGLLARPQECDHTDPSGRRKPVPIFMPGITSHTCEHPGSCPSCPS